MERLLDKIERLEKLHDRLDPELVERKKVRLGLRKPDGTGVVAGITSKGQVVAYKTKNGKKVQIPGKLIYCGYDVEEIVENVERDGRYGFEETVYLLLAGELPTAEDLDSINQELGARRALPDMAKEILSFNSRNDDQMSALHTAVASLHRFDKNPRSTDIRDVTSQCIDIIAKFPTIIAYNYKVMKANGHGTPEFIEPRPDLNTAQNFLYMLSGKVPDDKIAKVFDLCLILHAEHGGGNNSTFTVRTVSSAQTDTYMAICAGIASLAGHLHGGANEAVMNMMKFIKEGVKDWKDEQEIHQFLRDIMINKRGDGTGKIFGMGHAVYNISDPREIILKAKSMELAKQAGRLDEFWLYSRVADEAVKVIESIKGKKICPNVDFYSGFVYDMLGLEQELFTPIFAMSRVSGWAAHRIEEIIQGKLIRPAYVSSLPGTRDYTPLDKR